VKFLFEKINTHVPTDDLYVAIYGGKAGDWKKDSLKEKDRFYSLLGKLRRKIPVDCLEGKISMGYTLSGSVDMTSQGSPSMREEIKRTPVQDKMVCSSKISINIEKKELEIDGKIIAFGDKAFKAVKLLFEGINTFVPTDDLYVAVYEGKAGDWKKDSMKEKNRFYLLFQHLRESNPDYITGTSNMGYMLSNPNDLVDVSYQGFETSPKKIKGTDDADSSEVSENEEDGGNLQKIQYDSENYPLIGDCYLDDYDQFIKDNESIRSRYLNVQKSPGFVRIGGIYISFTENKVIIGRRYVAFSPRDLQILRLLALWYPDAVSHEQIYYNLSFDTKGDYASRSTVPRMRRRYVVDIIGHVQEGLRSLTEGNYINFSKGIGYKLVCHSKRQTCPNESSVQDALHSQSTSSICTLAQGEQMQSVA
jgi:DNA-binding winged helix-turn-helix (wHTH) protein